MHPQQEQGTAKTYTDNQCWQCGEVGHLKRSCPMLKRQVAVSREECMNSPINSHSHSQCISTKSSTLGGKNVARESNRNPQRNTLNPDPWTRLIGRANEEKIMVNGKSVTALLDTGSQVTHISHDYCQAMGIPIHPITQLVQIEGMGRYHRICGLH